MIRYALACDRGHDFESWFSSASAFDEQAERGLVECPYCGSPRVAKQIMAPSVARTDRAAGPPSALAAGPPDAVPVMPSAPGLPAVVEPPREQVALLGEEQKQLREALRRLHAHVTANAEDVGRRFADEARKIHNGDAPERVIMGQADRDEVAELIEDGIPIAPLPILPDDRN